MTTQKFAWAYERLCTTINDYNLIPKDKNKIVMLYTGGKDSSVCADLLVEYMDRLRPDLSIKMLTVRFPEIVYNSTNPEQRQLVEKAVEYWEDKGCVHKMVEVPSGIGDHLFDGKEAPCGVCEDIKAKTIYDELSGDVYRNALVCFAHTVGDIAGYLSEAFYIGACYSGWREIQRKNPVLFHRLLELSKRVYPKYAPSSVSNNTCFIKPLIELEEDVVERVRDERRYPEIPERCSKIRGEKFKLYKRFVMEGIDWLGKRYRNTDAIYSNMLHRNYRRMLKKYQDIGLIPDLETIEDMSLNQGYGGI